MGEPIKFSAYVYSGTELKGMVKNFFSFIWTDRYDEPGDFELVLPYNITNIALYQKDRYLVSNLSIHAMVIEEIKFTESGDEGFKMMVTGRSLESILDRRICMFSDFSVGQTFERGLVNFQINYELFTNGSQLLNNLAEAFARTFVDSYSGVRALTNMYSPKGKSTKQASNYSNPYTPADNGRQLRGVGSLKFIGIFIDGLDYFSNRDVMPEIKVEGSPYGQTLLDVFRNTCQSYGFGFAILRVLQDSYLGGTYNLNHSTAYAGDMHLGLYTGHNWVSKCVLSISQKTMTAIDYATSKEPYKNYIYVEGDSIDQELLDAFRREAITDGYYDGTLSDSNVKEGEEQSDTPGGGRVVGPDGKIDNPDTPDTPGGGGTYSS